MSEPARDSGLDDADHDGKGKKIHLTRCRCSRCGKVKASATIEIPIGWYHIFVTTNLPGEGVKVYGSFACSRACYDALKLARIDSSKA